MIVTRPDRWRATITRHGGTRQQLSYTARQIFLWEPASVNLTQASLATGLTKKALRALISSGDITATKGKKDWDIDATSLADKVGLPSFMTWQQTNKAMQEQLDQLLSWKAEVEHELVVLKAKVALKHISRRQLAEWLGTHGLNSHSWEQIRARIATFIMNATSTNKMMP